MIKSGEHADESVELVQVLLGTEFRVIAASCACGRQPSLARAGRHVSRQRFAAGTAASLVPTAGGGRHP